MVLLRLYSGMFCLDQSVLSAIASLTLLILGSVIVEVGTNILEKHQLDLTI